jgi:hypothetical protein
MNRVTSMFREPRAWLAVLGLAGCNQLEKLGATDTAGATGMPPEVRAAFEDSCGKSGCHVAGGTAPTLTGGSLDALVGTEYVTIGDIPGSLIAVKMLPDATLEALGLKRESGARMPLDQDFLNPNNQIILAWIAGAEFADTGGGSTGGDTATTGATATTGEPAAPTFTNVQAIFTASCSCHTVIDPPLGSLSLKMADAYANIVNVKAVGLPTMNLITPNDPDNSYLYFKLTHTGPEILAAGGMGGMMPDGAPLSADQLLLIEEWINAGAPND